MVCTACYYVLLLVEIWSAVVYKFVCLEVRIKVISESRENIGKNGERELGGYSVPP